MYGVLSVSVQTSSQVFAELTMQQTVGFPVRLSSVESSDAGAPIDRNITPHRWGWTSEWWSVGDTHSILQARKCIAADTRNYPHVLSSVNITAADRSQNPRNVIQMLYAEPRKSPRLAVCCLLK
jgi:hypothetical protein